MSFIIDYTNGAIIYDLDTATIKSQFMMHAYDEFRVVCQAFSELIPLTEAIYGSLTEKAKTKIGGSPPDFAKLQEALNQLNHKFEETEKRIQEAKEKKPNPESSGQMFTLEELEAREREFIEAIELKEREELLARQLALESTPLES